MTASTRLLENPYPEGITWALQHSAAKRRHWTPGRRGNIEPRVIVIHMAQSPSRWWNKERPPELKDRSAEKLARYGATTRRKVSWHACTDSDGVVWCVRDTDTAWHCRGANDYSLGLELTGEVNYWGHKDVDTSWQHLAVTEAAKVAAIWCHRWNINPVWISAEAARYGESGIVTHAVMDPARRTDPGINFPANDFIRFVENELITLTAHRVLTTLPPIQPVRAQQELSSAEFTGAERLSIREKLNL